MKSPSRPRTTADLPESITRQLNMYVLAAGAAGVGVLALSEPAAAKIVYTRANVTFGLNQQSTFAIDLNHDGITDYTLVFGYSVQTGNFTSSLRVHGGANSVWRAQGSRQANCAKAGSIIGPIRNFAYGSFYMGYIYGSLHHADSSLVVVGRGLGKALRTAISA